MNLICLVFALVCFILAALDVKISGVHMEPVGFCFLVTALIFRGLPAGVFPWNRPAP